MAIFSLIAGWVAYGIGYLGAAAGLSVAAATAIGTAAGYLAAAVVASAVSRALQPKISIPQSEIQAVINQTSAPRRVYVGENLAGGVRALFAVTGRRLFQLVVVAHGPITEFVQYWIDGVPVTVNANGEVRSGKYVVDANNQYTAVRTRDGSSLGGDYSELPGLFSDWNSSRELNGQATFLSVMYGPNGEDFAKVFPRSSNTLLQWVIRGQALYDNRTDTTAYSDNAALVIAHYLTHDDGYKLSDSDVNWDSIDAMADVADIEIDQLAGGTAPNLRLWGYWTLDESPVDVLDRFHSNSGIRAYETQDGTIGLIGGGFGEPACTLTAKDISQIQTSEAISEREGYNTLRVFHLDPEQKYEVIEVDSWVDSARLAVEGEIPQEYRMEMCPNRSQARRLAKEQLHDDNRARVEVITNLVGLKARFPREHGQRHTILLDYQPEDGSGRVIQGEYEVMDHDFDPVGLVCRIELKAVDRASASWTPEEEGSAHEALPTPEANPAPDISAVLSQRVVNVSASVKQAMLDVAAVPIADRDDLEVEARYRKTGTTAWESMVSSGYDATSGAVEDGEEYEAQVRFNGVFDAPDVWEDLGPITIQIDATPPGQPAEFIPSNGSGYVHLSWRNPAGAFYEIRVYRNTVSDFGSASLVDTTGGASGQISEYQDETIAASTEYFYWLAAANVSGVEGTAAGPANITTT